MAQLRKERKGKQRKGQDTSETHKSVLLHTRIAKNTIFTNSETFVDLSYVKTYAISSMNRLKGGHFAAVQNLPFSITSIVGLVTNKHLRAAVKTKFDTKNYDTKNYKVYHSL